MKNFLFGAVLLSTLFLVWCDTTTPTNILVNDEAEQATGNELENPTPTEETLPQGEGKKAGEWYTTYNEAIVQDALDSGKKVAFFFHAARCPTCIALNENIESNYTNIPADTHIFKVDYDTSDELKETYGVTMQHTLVYIDQNRELVNKVSGPPTLDDVLAGFAE
jgi:hypothetical protein